MAHPLSFPFLAGLGVRVNRQAGILAGSVPSRFPAVQKGEEHGRHVWRGICRRESRCRLSDEIFGETA